MNPGHPPCCQIPFIKRTFEDSACCIATSKIGTEWGDRNRVSIMFVASLFSFLGLILSLVCLIGISTDADTVMNTAWNIGETTGLNLYVGVNVMVVESGGETYKNEWDSVDCSAGPLIESGSDVCNSCKEAATGVLLTVIGAFVTSITTLQTDVQRSTRAGDLNCQKFMGALTAFLGFFSTLLSLSTYVDGCSRELPEHTAAGDSITWTMGPGFICLLVATIIKPVDFFAHMIVPVVKPDASDEDGNIKSAL